jgi:iron complex outermembrane receptor protein
MRPSYANKKFEGGVDMVNRFRLHLSFGGLLALFGLHAWAADTADVQSAPPAAAALSSPSALEEVVVTARRREESLRNVPISVTAISGNQLEQQQINTVKDIAAITPGLDINSDSVGRVFMSIRGVGTTLIDTVQPGVGIFVDGVYEPNTSYLNLPIVDVERIEVLRGPQGTLFGNNTLGGAISVITKQPSDEFEGHVSIAGAGPDDYQTAALSVSGPLIPGVLQGRIAVAYHDQEGFQKNYLAGGYANPLYQRSAHGTLRFEPADFAVFTLNLYYDQVKGGNTPYQDVSGTTDFHLGANTNINSIELLDYRGGNLKGVFDVPALATTITAIASYDQRTNDGSGDGDYSPIDFLLASGSGTFKTTTGEVRFDTKFSDNVSTLIGLFATGYTNDQSADTTLVPLGITAPSTADSSEHAQAGYGTVFWKFAPEWEFAAGLRYDHQILNGSNTGVPTAEYSANEWEPRFTLSKHLSEDVMTYASIARGFRGGGTNGPGAPNPIYKGDSVWTYELGTKMELLDRRVAVNWDVFYNDYSNYIGQNALAPSTTGVGFVGINLNAGHVKSYGTELEGHIRATEQLRFDAGLTLMHARVTNYNEFVETTGITPPSDRILFVPDWSYNVDVDYTVPLALNSLEFQLGATGKGDRVGSDLANPVVPVMPSYTLVNGAITYHFPKIEVAFFATNLLDAKYQESYIDSSLLKEAGLPAPIISNLAIQGDRRRLGLRMRWDF